MRFIPFLAVASAALALQMQPAQAFLSLFAPPPSAAVQPEREVGPDLTSPIPREVVVWRGPYAPGTVVVSTGERRLYLVLPGDRALRYGIGVGRPGFTWTGVQRIARKAEWPDWTPPPEMLKRRPDLPRFMRGGEDNPLGARALYLGSSLYRIHGSNEPTRSGRQCRPAASA
jgi:lipoprotein-anchoring transpeptidase ErfK/SrfK